MYCNFGFGSFNLKKLTCKDNIIDTLYRYLKLPILLKRYNTRTNTFQNDTTDSSCNVWNFTAAKIVKSNNNVKNEKSELFLD